MGTARRHGLELICFRMFLCCFLQRVMIVYGFISIFGWLFYTYWMFSCQQMPTQEQNANNVASEHATECRQPTSTILLLHGSHSAHLGLCSHQRSEQGAGTTG
ncbi:hypothetical protein GDO78_018938 [Eleutherodactylus coqui]|uniref:Uncharacterized protein n=1 Tax=Eleutherodactylus coqui TaxID=57060 RepID=A0A8J6BPZ0_ELECQ|nr:hypothetical protein GDO78_018938 [Eleutherodactylus coqui]